MIIKYIFSLEDGLAAVEGFESEYPDATLKNCPQFAIIKEGKGTLEQGFTVYVPSMVSRFTVADFEAYLERNGIAHEKLYLETEAKNGEES